jgi:hypothetical protein
MKYILVFFLVFFSLSKQDISMFDFQNTTPISFLDYLVENNQVNFVVVNNDSIPVGWVNFDLLPELMNRIESKRITAPVFSIYAGVDLNRKIRTTEGVEALHLIESLRRKMAYPMLLSSENYGYLNNHVFYPDTILVREIKQWYRKRSHNNR